MLFTRFSKKDQYCALTLFFSKNGIFFGGSGWFWVKFKGGNIFLVFGLFERFLLKKIDFFVFKQKSVQMAENKKK